MKDGPRTPRLVFSSTSSDQSRSARSERAYSDLTQKTLHDAEGRAFTRFATESVTGHNGTYMRFCDVYERVSIEGEDRDEAIDSHVASMIQYEILSEQEGSTLQELMSGESELNSVPRGRNHAYRIRERGVPIEPYYPPSGVGLLTGGTHFTGRDLGWVSDRFPRNKYKFYLSLDVTTEEQKQKADKFFFEFFREVQKQNLTCSTKSFDHDYDSCNIYTFDKEAVQSILALLYKKYMNVDGATDNIFIASQRYLQSPIQGIDPEHIAWVQEPDDIDMSYSTKMGRFAEEYAQHRAEGDNPWSAYFKACTTMKVLPESPWLVDDTHKR